VNLNNKEGDETKLTIIYDNDVWTEGLGLKAAWGFSCLVEAYDKNILFDTGGRSSILLNNMERLSIDPSTIDEIVISHAHGDHTGGLSDFLKINSVKVYIPSSCQEPRNAKEVIKVKEPLKLQENIFSTGTLKGIEQSLAVKTAKGLVIVVGCAHSGVYSILEVASQFGKPWALIGGLHGFNDFDLIEKLESICPVHCTRYKSKIKSLYPEKYIEGGVGKIIEV
jgi:7,8-dihydropterin-6-yl-methyl-4-(beta-D-ribofuranosyl)aminobenzene 5'-phosphate synthase